MFQYYKKFLFLEKMLLYKFKKIENYNKEKFTIFEISLQSNKSLFPFSCFSLFFPKH